MKIAFLGLPIAGLLLAADGHDVVWAGVYRRGAPGTRRLVRTLGADRVAVVPLLDGEDVVARIAAAEPELLVSWFWTKRVPARVRALAPLGAIGVHPSLLPRHRGPDPFFWAIDQGDRETGVTAHRLEDEYDTGAVLGRRALAIDPRWNAWTLAKRLDRPSLSLLRETVAAFSRGAPPAETAQDEAQATEAPAPDDEALEIDWSQTTAAVERRVRAAAPWPGAYTFLGDSAVIVTRVEAAERFPKVLEPGEGAVSRRGDHNVALVRTGDGAAWLLEGRDEDDAPLDAAGIAEIMEKTRAPL